MKYYDSLYDACFRFEPLFFLRGDMGHPLTVFPDFRKLFAGRVVSAVGDKFFTMALAWLVLSEAGAHGKMRLGLIMGLTALPSVIFGPFMGALADRHDRRLLMLAADSARMFLLFLLGALAFSHRLGATALYLLCFLIASFFPLFESAAAGSLLGLTDEEHLGAAAATDSSVQQLSSVFGSALGSVLMAVMGAAGAFFFNSCTYLISFTAVFMIKTDLRPRRKVRSVYSADIREGALFLLSRRPLLSLLLVFGAFNFFVGPLLLVIPMLAKYTVAGSVKWLAVFETFFAAGSALAAAAVSSAGGLGNVYRTLFLSVLFVGIPFFSLYFASDGRAICVLLFVAGAALGCGNAAAAALFQNSVPENYKGRFFSVLTAVCYAVLPVTYAVNGLLADIFSAGFVILFNSCSLLLLSFLILVIPKVPYNGNPEAADA